MGKSKRNRNSSTSAPSPAAPSGFSDSIIIPDARDRMLELIEREQLPADVNSALTGALSGDMIRQQLLFQAMIDTWPRLQKCLREIQLKVRNAPWTSTPWAPRGAKPTAEAEARAKVVENAIWNMRPDMIRGLKGFEGTVEEITMGYFLGHYAGEIHWHQDWVSVGENVDRQLWQPKCTKTLPPRYYGYPAWDHGEDRVMLDPTGGQGGVENLIDFPPNRFLVAVNGGHPGHPSIAAPLRALAGFWLAAVYGRKWLMQFAQLFGIPFRWATYPKDDTTSKNAVVEMLRKVGSEGWGAFPDKSTLNFVDSSKGGSSLVQAELLKIADEQCDVFILGQTLTSSQGEKGSQSLGNVHMEVLDGHVRGVCDFVGEVLSFQLSPAIIEVNYGTRREVPGIWAKWPEKKDHEKLAQRDSTLGILDGSFPVEKQWLYERHDVPMPAAGAELFEPKKDDPPVALGPNGKPLPGLPAPGKGLPQPKEEKPPKDRRKKIEASIREDLDDGAWMRFDRESGTVGVPRAEMPQIKSGNRAAMVGYLRARGIESRAETILPVRLKPTQAEYHSGKVAAAKSFAGGDRAILISEDNHVVDGHHQWLGMLEKDPKQPIRVIRLLAPIGTVLAKVRAMPSTTFDAISGRRITAGGFRTLEDGQVIYIHNLRTKSEGDATADLYRDGPASEREAADDRADRDKANAHKGEAEPSADELRESEEESINELAEARKEYEAEMLEESMSGFPEIGATLRGRLPRPEDLGANESLKGEVQRIWDRFKKETAKRDGKGRKVISPAGAADYFAPKGTKVDLDVLRQQMNAKGFDFATPAEMLEAVFDSLEGRKSWGTTSDGYGIAASAADDPELARLMRRMGKVLESGSLVDEDAIAGLFAAAWVQGAKEGGEEP